MEDDVARSSSIERQLGEVVGTVRMAVSAVETLRETVEKLAERAAFRADLEAQRTESDRKIEDSKSSINAKITELKSEVERQRVANEATRKWISMASGGLLVLSTLLTLFGPALRAKFGV